MSAVTTGPGPGSNSITEAARNRHFGSLYSRNVRAVVARGLMATKSSNWMVMLSGFFEPVLYLISMGVGLGAIVGAVRADYFWGWGAHAEAQAGRMMQPLHKWVLWPRSPAP